MHVARLVSAIVGLVLLAACGGPPATPAPTAPADGTPVETRLLTTSRAPIILTGSILVASDLDTLRALVDAMDDRPPTSSSNQCRPPYVDGHDVCWPGARSQPDHAFLALALSAGWCQIPSRPQLYLLPGHRLVLLVGFTRGSCFGGAASAPLPGANLVAAATPRAGLVSISTTGLAPGLYAVSYRFLVQGSTYDSDPTYLSVPGPAAASQSTIEAQAAAVLARGANGRGPVVSVARVDGDQVGDLCGADVDGPAFLLTAGSAVGSPRQVTIVLAGPTPRTCTATST